MGTLTATSPQLCRWHDFSTTAELEQSAAHAILQAAEAAVRLRGAFHIVLAGGTTPRRIYAALRKADADWNAWHVYFSDERCLPAYHPERNSKMAMETWLDQVSIPPGQIHPIQAELGAGIAASAYAKTLKNIPLFDLVLLGLGEDGHTASLFPGHDLGSAVDSPAVLAVGNAPKFPPQRVSLGAHRLSAARKVFFIVSGASKKKAIQNWLHGIPIPAAAIRPQDGIDVYLETALLETNH